MTLTEIGRKYATDKNDIYAEAHNYLPAYESVFQPMRYEKIVLLEIGIWHGESLRMWREYFPNATIIGIDNEDRFVNQDIEGVHLYKADLNDLESAFDAFSQIIMDHGPHAEVDIFIDDGGHTMTQQQHALWLAAIHCKLTGMVVIEDLHTSALEAVQKYSTDFGVKADGSNSTRRLLCDLAEAHQEGNTTGLANMVKPNGILNEKQISLIQERMDDILHFSEKLYICRMR